MAQDVFGGKRFWAALERLADRREHGDHPRMLHGTTERTDSYAYRCVSCERPIATMQVRHEPGDAAPFLRRSPRPGG